jgi:hypothetical protein
MKVYEIGVEDHYDECGDGEELSVDCTLWVAVEDGVYIISQFTNDNTYIKELPYDENVGGIDFIIRKDRL